jgi:hypothetical protein
MERAASLDVRCFVVKSCIVIGIDMWIWVKKVIPKTCAVHFMVAHQHSSAIQVTRSPQLWRLHLQKSPPCDASNTLALKFGTIRRLKAMGLHLRECAASINCDLHCIINSWLVASQDDIIQLLIWESRLCSLRIFFHILAQRQELIFLATNAKGSFKKGTT